MELFFTICIGISAGIVIGFLLGGMKLIFGRRSYSKKQIELSKQCVRKMASVLKYVTFLALLLGFVWCVYFLVLGIARPQECDYANNMAELIVAVLTVISIIFAFVEFLRRSDDK